MEDINDNTKNLYIIRRRLAERVQRPGVPFFDYFVGNFVIKIRTPAPSSNTNDRITFHDILEVSLYEEQRASNGRLYDSPISLERDSRFQNYKPIKYHETVGFSDGRKMPINHLCELIIYLHRLSNLSAFM